jgi:hypothetical protein
VFGPPARGGDGLPIWNTKIVIQQHLRMNMMMMGAQLSVVVQLLSLNGEFCRFPQSDQHGIIICKDLPFQQKKAATAHNGHADECKKNLFLFLFS